MDTLIARTTEQLNAQPAVESTAVELGESQIEVRSQGFGETLVVLSGVGAEVSYLGGFGGFSLAANDRFWPKADLNFIPFALV